MKKLKDKYDVIILGSGPSAYASAVRCAQLGLLTLCIDNSPGKGNFSSASGNISSAQCLETIALLESAKFYSRLIHDAFSFGITVQNITLTVQNMMAHKNSIISEENQRLQQVFSNHGIDFLNAKAKLVEPKVLEVTHPTTTQRLTAEHIILATESLPISVACAPIDNEYIVDSSAALNLSEVPNRLAILGAGVIGLELGGIWNRLGSETILLDAQESFLSVADNQISREVYKIFAAQGLELRLGARVISTKISQKKVLIEYQDSEGSHAIRVDKLIVASGRRPNSENLAAPEVNLLLDENNFVHVSENCRTNLPGVYAIGDLNMLGPMLPHKGMAEGVYVAEQIAGIHAEPIDYGMVPNIIYTEPGIAWIGQTEQSLRSKGDDIKIAVMPINKFMTVKAFHASEGMVKIISCAKTDIIRGVHIIGSPATELIAEAVVAMEFSASSEDIAKTVHAHPSIAEVIRQACQHIKSHNPN